ncbi:ABC transporter ATP-binding protein [Taylorella equigenitalis]|uniref:Nitrate transport ATP-binding protein NrtC n=1 Tax=Taylorella equigenitalis (strain MCE9) TaxID=937774 RepID=A0A654KIH8_TAYEM|nr:ABC transporter ATP-binding protein [Taylorella equigenitalis]ADU92215.1 nitrate transport ATP-binding protein NrtC [Taylorella equigenitalis MCE9]WDU56965.1 ABC transporter ATP-binding protein [Taylorella equigenitalis]
MKPSPSTCEKFKLEIKNLNHSLMGQEVINLFSMKIKKGEIACLYGPSGCGKTTILRIIAGLIDCDSGHIYRNTKVCSYLFQEHRLLQWRTVLDNVLLVTKNPKDPQNIERAKALLRKLHLTQKDLEKYPSELSGGMKQRTSIARALIGNPDLLLLDEPFTALDYELKLELYELLHEYVKDDCAIVMVSHDRFESLKLANTIYLLKDKPTSCRQILNIETPYSQRDESFINKYLKESFWSAYHD